MAEQVASPLDPNLRLSKRDTVELPPAEQQLTELRQGRAHFAGGRVDYTFERPLEYVDDPTPEVIIHGYVGIKSAYSRLRRNLAQLGKPAVSIRPVRTHGRRAALSPQYLLNPSALHSRAAYAVLNQLSDGADVDQFDLTAHSMGGWVASGLAERHPDRVRSVVLMASAGLEDHSLPSLVGRLPAFFRRELLPHLTELRDDNETRLALEALHYVLRSPSRTLMEGIGVSQCDIRPRLSRLGQLGVRTAILNFAADELICNRSTEAEVGHLVDHCETHPSVHLGHLAPQLEPLTVARSLRRINQAINQ